MTRRTAAQPTEVEPLRTLQPLTSSSLLEVWDAAVDAPPIERAVALLAAAHPEGSAEAVAAWTMGERDAGLLTLREWAFGPDVSCLADCTSCGEPLELHFRVPELRIEPRTAVPAVIEVTAAGYLVRHRLPTSADLAAVLADGHDTSEERALLARCVLSCHLQGANVETGDLPEQVVREVGRSMAAADPQAGVELPLTCQTCGHRWVAPLDIAALLWGEVDAWAVRLLRDVHRLARAYGWREADVLELSPRRRQRYLELVGA